MTDSSSLKPGWRRVKFGDVVRLSKTRSQNPLEDGYDRFVGLEHLESGDLRIRSWGDVADGITFTSIFKPGQVLFGKRRAYQRKVAVADFAGVCSGDIYVLESRNPQELLPELLPFICQTDAFFDHAVGTSAGSLSPRTNWASLADFEFDLPEIKQQFRLIDSLKSCLEVINSIDISIIATSKLLESFVTTELNRIITFNSLKDMCIPIVRGIDSPGPEIEDGVPYVRVSEMTGTEGIVLKRLKRTHKSIADSHPSSKLIAGDIVVALRGVVGYPVVVPSEAEGANLSRGTARVSPLAQHRGEYIYWSLRSPNLKREVLRVANGWKGEDLREITLNDLRELKIPAPAIDEQERIGKIASQMNLVVKALEARKTEVKLGLIKTLDSALKVNSNV